MIDTERKISQISFHGNPLPLYWQGSPREIFFGSEEISECISQTHLPLYLVKDFNGRIGVSNGGALVAEGRGLQVLAMAMPMEAKDFGDKSFCKEYGVKYAYKTGAMANGIASERLVIAMGQAGLMGSFGAAGLVPSRVSKAIDIIQNELKDGAYAFNLIHSPNEPKLEAEAVDLFIEKGVHVVEASAYLALTEHIVYYRLAGLHRDASGEVIAKNRVIAKISRKEVARHFMRPAPEKMINALLEKGKITYEQAEMAREIPMADDITVEADSGGHTDNRPLVALLPIIIELRNQIETEYRYAKSIRVGAAGGISTPSSALAAFMMGAAYIVTGSINQACVEAGTSEFVRKVLAEVESTDIMMAPASDMFEMGVELQVLKKGTMFGPRAKKLYEYYRIYNGIDEIPSLEREKLEKLIFKKPLEKIWAECIDFFNDRDPVQITRAKENPRRKMALIFRWYLGLSSSWANAGVKDRQLDYQIWCGPSMGAFNDWVRGTDLENYQSRDVVSVAEKIMLETAILYRIRSLEMQGVTEIIKN